MNSNMHKKFKSGLFCFLDHYFLYLIAIYYFDVDKVKRQTLHFHEDILVPVLDATHLESHPTSPGDKKYCGVLLSERAGSYCSDV